MLAQAVMDPREARRAASSSRLVLAMVFLLKLKRKMKKK